MIWIKWPPEKIAYPVPRDATLIMTPDSGIRNIQVHD